MKILAIRGKNLASLGGDFAVELASPPLKDAGIFAITGPTGAGKTTLLDALCLALFDRTPRLSDRGGVRVGFPGDDDALWIASQDVRTLLRKGCAFGAAEVDFLGRDGLAYRARWTVRRARDRSEGQLQPQVMTLQVMETGEFIGRTKSEVLAAIEARLGLSFEQFRRSALLAQGDFAAFLKAGDRERAELLEQMTGTSLYGQLSILAHERSKNEQRLLDALRERLGGISLLSDAERADLLVSLQQAEAQAEQARRQLLAAEEARAHLHQLACLIEQEQAAIQACEEARAAWISAAAEQAALSRAEALLPLLPALDRIHRLESSIAVAQQEAKVRMDALHAVQLTMEQTFQQYSLARAALETHQGRLVTLAPELQQAALLDAEILATTRQVEQLFQESAAASAALQEATRAAKDLERSREDNLRRRLEAAEALTRAAPLAGIVRDWSHWRGLLKSYVVASRELAAQDRRGKQDALARAQQEAQTRGQARAALEERLLRAMALVQDAEELVGRLDPTALRQRGTWLSGRQNLLARLHRIAEEARSAADALRQQEEAVEQHRQNRELWSTRARQAALQRELLDTSLQEAQRALEQTSAALDLTARRALLREGEPCPLCGSTEHPWVKETPALDALLHTQCERVAYLMHTRQQVDREEVSARGRMQDLTLRIQEAEALAERYTHELDAARLSWSKLRGEIALDALPLDPASQEAQSAVIEAERIIEAEFREVQQEQQRAEEAQRSLARARRELDRERGAFDVAREEAEAAQKAVEVARLALERTEDIIARRRAEQESILEELAPAFAGWEGWRDELTGDVIAFGQRCAAEVARYLTNEQALREAEEALAASSRELEGALARVTEREVLQMERARFLAEHQGRLEELRAQRAKLLGGEPVEQVRRRLQEAIDTASREERVALESYEAAARAMTAARTQADSAAEALDRLQEELTSEQAALDQALAAQGARHEQLLQVAGEVDGLRARREALDSLRETLERAELIAAERSARRREHEASRAGAEGDPEAAAEQASRALAAAEERLSTAKVRLSDDDARRS
ncbi:MAG: AAA family ATPase, partial [Myxococcales bacterium]|nr:AAA family ATPase [Polyangiaceae bacterium]MDW8248592.1 AAA family ATPase [Myxococcales bacterium]